MPLSGLAKKLNFPGVRKEAAVHNVAPTHSHTAAKGGEAPPSANSHKRGSCPFADLSISVNPESPAPTGCPFHAHKASSAIQSTITKPVPLAVHFGTHTISQGSIDLLRDIGGGDRIREVCTRFYARMHEDSHLKQFIFLDDGPVHHGQRLADWIIEKMGGEGTPWTDSGRSGMRQPSHRAAWDSARRHPSVRGERFKLDDTRVWMRLHFWAAREAGLDKHAPFFKWYVSFIKHFIAVYERRAPAYAQESADWSANDENIKVYLRDNTMHDVIGVGRY